jgi:hypothetical protein
MSNPPKPPGCDKNIDGDQLASLRDVSTDDMKALINSHANDKCRNELLNSLQSTVDRGSTTATWIEEHAGGSMGWGGGSANIGASAGRNTTNNDRIDEDSRTSAITEGCRQTLYNMNNSNTLYSQLACNMKSASNTIDSDIKMGASISIIVGPTEAMVAQHERHLAGIDATILAIAAKNPVTEIDVKLMEKARQMADDAISKFRFDIRNSKFTITSNNIQNLKTTNNQAIDDNTKVKEAITKKATAEAVTAITQKYELGAGAVANLESYAGTKINDASLTTAMDIIAAANDTKMDVDQQGNITLRVNGSLDGINVDITQGNLTELRSELVMKAATTLGRDIANEIIHEQSTKTEAQIEALGLVSLQKAIADGLAAQAKSMEQPDMFGGGLFGGMFGKIAMIVIPIIIILVLFSMFGFKIALVAGLLFGIYLAIAYFVGLPPFSKENNATLPVELVYDTFMRVLLVPRRKALFHDLLYTIGAEKTRIRSSMISPPYYVEQLDSAMSWITESAGVPFLLKHASWKNPEPPPWVKAAMFDLERDSYTLIINMLEDVRDNNGDGVHSEPGLDASPIIPRLRQERDELIQFSENTLMSSFDFGLKMSAFDSATAYANANPPTTWRDIFSRYQEWINRGRPSGSTRNVNANANANANIVAANPYAMASTSSMSRGIPMAMDNQQAAGTYGQGYAMAMDNQQAAGTYGQGYAMAMDNQQAAGTYGQGYAMAMDNQQAAGTYGQGYAMADRQQAYVAAQPQTVESVMQVRPVESHITQAQPHRVQKSYTNSGKKKPMYSMKKMQNTYDNTKDISKKGYEMRVANMIQREYSRNRDSIKPAYNKVSVYKK